VSAPAHEAGPPERSLPPIQQIAIAVLALIVVGGIYTAAHLPRHVPQGPTIGLLVAATVLLGVNAALLARIEGFAWRTFRLVAGWVLLAYVVIAGMLEYVFVYDHTSGTQLVILTLMLLVFAVNIPMLLGFSVARFQDPDPARWWARSPTPWRTSATARPSSSAASASAASPRWRSRRCARRAHVISSSCRTTAASTTSASGSCSRTGRSRR
jgi:hypothetical protein